MIGLSFVEYVMICKMEEAKRLLLDTEKSVNDIALSIGNSEGNLNRIFQRYLKQSPGQFHKQLLNKELRLFVNS
ncbi:helix-turn-helix transcriptional regulator [Paenibacillus periandrae]|uniref:helix-turn-helix transcriptional regulator n=1 Tax=Paenibacillus periandrae TaxID=1761741 RepID=UPI001F0963E2|nr:helix-turn-helix transcriptional regulator [Paenibacillus periandrae]